MGKPTQISDVWEVQLQADVWRRLRLAAAQRRTTYSNVTRYCIFRLAEKQNLRWNSLFLNAVKSTKVVGNDEMHRHMVCLYGEDVRLLRLAAMTLGITVSAFVRLALWLYLPRVAMDIRSKRTVSATELFLLGGKRKDDADPLWRRQRVVNIRFAGRGGLEAVKAWIAKNF